MLVVSNTSPLSNLAVIGRLDLLSARYGSVTIPAMVWQELDAFSHQQAKQQLQEALTRGWIVMQPLPESHDLSSYLERADPGESEAIALAEFIGADKILLDDRAGRTLARERGLNVAGVLGVLLYAKRQDLIDSVHLEIKLRRVSLSGRT